MSTIRESLDRLANLAPAAPVVPVAAGTMARRGAAPVADETRRMARGAAPTIAAASIRAGDWIGYRDAGGARVLLVVDAVTRGGGYVTGTGAANVGAHLAGEYAVCAFAIDAAADVTLHARRVI